MASLKYYRIRANSGLEEDYFKGQVPRLRLHGSWILLIVLRLFSFFQGLFKVMMSLKNELALTTVEAFLRPCDQNLGTL